MAKADKSAAGDDKQSKPDFEEALAEMETIVQKMENNQLSLDESLACLKRGIELGKICHHKLNQAEQQVLQLVEKEQGYELGELTSDIPDKQTE